MTGTAPFENPKFRRNTSSYLSPLSDVGDGVAEKARTCLLHTSPAGCPARLSCAKMPVDGKEKDPLHLSYINEQLPTASCPRAS